VNSPTLSAGLAGIALIAGVAATVAPARAASAAPSPSPSPSPPAQALSCTANNNPGLMYGTLPSAAGPNVQVNTTVQVIPNTADGRAYLTYQETQVKNQAAKMSATPAPATAASPANYLSVQNQSENFSALVQRLSPFIETTSTDAQGNWACADLTLSQPYLLFAALTMNSTTTATPAPAVAMVSGNQPVTKTQTTQIYYAAQATVRVINPGSPGIFHLNLPFAKWIKIAQIVQPS